jgi:hypothetical protein
VLFRSSDVIKKVLAKKVLKTKGKKQLEELKIKQKQEQEELRIKQEQDKLKQEDEQLKLATTSGKKISNAIAAKLLRDKFALELKELRLKQKQEQFAIKFKEQKQSKAIGELQVKYKKFKETNKETYDMYYYEKKNIEDDYDNKIRIKNATIAKYEQEIKDNTLSTLGSVGSLFSSKEDTQKRKDKIKTANDFIKKLKAEIKDLQFLKKSKLTKEKEKLNARLKVASGVVQSSKVFNIKILRTLKTNVKLNDKQRKEYLKKESDEIDKISKRSSEILDRMKRSYDDRMKKIISDGKYNVDELNTKIKEEEKIKRDNAPSTLGSLFISTDDKDEKKRKYELAIKYIKMYQEKLDKELKEQKKKIEENNNDKLKYLKKADDDALEQITDIKNKYKLIYDKVSRNGMIEADKLIKQVEKEQKEQDNKESNEYWKIEEKRRDNAGSEYKKQKKINDKIQDEETRERLNKELEQSFQQTLNEYRKKREIREKELKEERRLEIIQRLAESKEKQLAREEERNRKEREERQLAIERDRRQAREAKEIEERERQEREERREKQRQQKEREKEEKRLAKEEREERERLAKEREEREREEREERREKEIQLAKEREEREREEREERREKERQLAVEIGRRQAREAKEREEREREERDKRQAKEREERLAKEEKDKKDKKDRQKEVEKIITKIKDIDEEISPLYYTQYESEKGSMTISQRTKLYDKILRLYNKYSDLKKELSQGEFRELEKSYPEIESFATIKRDYIVAEKELIKQLEKKKTIPEYKTKEEVEALSKQEVKDLLIAFNVLIDGSLIYANVPPTDTKGRKDIRWAYNAFNRKFNTTK